MATLDNKAFRKTLQHADFKSDSSGIVEISHEGNSDFSFTYNIKDDTLQQLGELQLSEGQSEILKEKSYYFYDENRSESKPEDAFNTINYYDEYGISESTFL